MHQRKQYAKPAVRALNLAETPSVLRLYQVACKRRHASIGERVFSMTLRLALYADALNDAIAGIIVTGDDSPTGREPQAVGELDEQRTRRVNIECVAKGAARCLEAWDVSGALSRLSGLFVDLGIRWEDRS